MKTEQSILERETENSMHYLINIPNNSFFVNFERLKFRVAFLYLFLLIV